ncbi:MAG: hypothetical protein FJ271_16495 [Planctomycetes bacterium]|nr:hypothetical protein [Planctomycetota bacterium]
MNGPTCRTCNNGTLINRKVYRMSAGVVVIGYIFLIPSLIGVLVAAGLFFATGSATKDTAKKLKDEVAAELANAEVPQGIITKITDLKEVASADLSPLTEKQKDAVRSGQAKMAGGTIGVGIGAGLAGGTSLCVGFLSLVGALLGWLLVMKKRVLKCNQCGAVVPAS